MAGCAGDLDSVGDKGRCDGQRLGDECGGICLQSQVWRGYDQCAGGGDPGGDMDESDGGDESIQCAEGFECEYSGQQLDRDYPDV